MNLTQMANEVYNITKRPDLAALTTASLKGSTLKLHNSEFFYKDLTETSVSFGVAGYTQQLGTGNLSRFRSVKYARILDTSTSPVTPRDFFEPQDPAHILDSYGIDKTQIFYQAGSVLNFKGYSQFDTIIIGYYQYPDTTDASYSSWIADEHPWAIILDAAAKILKSTGYDQQAQGVRQLAVEAIQAIIATNITMVGE